MTQPLAVVTLFEGGYATGAAALINSVLTNGFVGTIWCGVRGATPSWWPSDGLVQGAAGECELRLVEVGTDMHLTNYKPYFMLEVAQRAPAVAGVVYIDPDIVVKCPWSFIDEWTSYGIAAIGDLNWNLPSSSPIRKRWARLCQEAGFDVPDGTEHMTMYCNAGFVGVRRDLLSMLDLWVKLEERLVRDDANFERFFTGDRTSPLMALDQDTFNIALGSYEGDLSLMGPEAMDFASGGQILSHAAGQPKPWNRRHIRDALCGRPPSKRDREFLRYAGSPLHALSASAVRRQVQAYRVGRVIGGLWRRDDY